MESFKEEEPERHPNEDFIDPLRQFDHENQEFDEKDLLSLLLSEEQLITDELNSGDLNANGRAIDKLLQYSFSRSFDIIHFMFEHDYIEILAQLYNYGFHDKILSIVMHIVQCEEEVLLNFMETKLYHLILSQLLGANDEDIKFFVVIFTNIIQKSYLTAAIFYSSGFFIEVMNRIEENFPTETREQYMNRVIRQESTGIEQDFYQTTSATEHFLWLVVQLINSIVKMRVDRNAAEMLQQRYEQISIQYPYLGIDKTMFDFFLQDSIDLSSASPIYKILRKAITIAEYPTICCVITHTLWLFLSKENDIGLPVTELANVVQNDIGFLSVMEMYLDTGEPHLVRSVIDLISLIISHGTAITEYIALQYLTAFSNIIINFRNEECIRTILDTLPKLLDFFDYSNTKRNTKKNDESIIDERLINAIRINMSSNSFKTRSAAIYSLLAIADVLNDLNILTENNKEGERPTQFIAELLESSIPNAKKIWIVERLKSILLKCIDDDPTKFILEMHDSEIFETIQDLLDDEDDDELVDVCDNFCELCIENEGFDL